MTEKKKWQLGIVLIGLCMTAFYLLHLGGYPLMEPDEGRYSEIPREMLATGDYITPRLNGVEYFEKPVLHYWITAGSFAVFGQTEAAARLWPAVAALLGICFTGWVGRSMFGGRTGTLAAVITGTSLLYIAIGSINILDMPLSLFITAALAFFYQAQRGGSRRWYAAAYLAMALGVLTKGLVAIVLPAGVFFWYAVLTRQWRLLREVLYLPGILLFFVVTAPWFWLVCQANADFFYFFFIREHFLRFATKMHDRYEPFWFFIPYIFLAVFPWTGFLPSLFAKDGIVRRTTSERNRRDIVYLLLWFGVIFLFYSLSDSKLIPYIVPCIPPLALLLAASLRRCEEEKRWLGWGLQGTVTLCVLFAAALIAYAFHSPYGAAGEFLLPGLGVCLPLLVGALAAWLVWKKTRQCAKAALVVAVMAFCFGIGLQQLSGLVAERRTAKYVSAAVAAIRQPGDRVACYGDYLQGMPFYLKERVLLVDYLGELEFGAQHASGAGWFLTKEEFPALWAGEHRLILAVKTNRLKNIFPEGKRRGATEVIVGNYTIITNK